MGGSCAQFSTLGGAIDLAYQPFLVSDGRRLHQLPLRAQPARRPRPGVQLGRVRGGLLQFSLGAGTGGAMGAVRPAPGTGGTLAVGGIHGGDLGRCAVVGGARAGAASPALGCLDGHGAPVQQRRVCGLDLGWWLGDSAVHLLRRARRGLPAAPWAGLPGSLGGIVGLGRRRPHPTGRAIDRRLLLRVVRGRHGSFRATLGRTPTRLPDCTVRGAGGRSLPVQIRLLRRVAAQHLLRQARSPLVRSGF